MAPRQPQHRKTARLLAASLLIFFGFAASLAARLTIATLTDCAGQYVK